MKTSRIHSFIHSFSQSFIHSFIRALNCKDKRSDTRILSIEALLCLGGVAMMLIACRGNPASSADLTRRPSEMESLSLGSAQAALIQDEMTCSPNYTSSDFGPVNLTTDDDQFAPAVAGLVGEKAIFVWEGKDQIVGYDGEDPIHDDDLGIYARVVNRDGTTFWPASGFDFHINSAGEETGDQSYPDVSARANATTARLSIVWMSDNEYGQNTGKDVVATVWTWADSTQSLTRNAIFNPTTTTSGDQIGPAVTHLWNTIKHVIVWQGADGNIYLSLCDNAGSCSPKEQQVNTNGFSACEQARADGFRSEENGGFVVVMVCEDDSEDLRHIYYRRYDDDAVALDTALQLVSHNEGDDDVHRPDVACLDNDNFVVVWESGNYSDESSIAVRRREMEYDGTDIASDQQVNTDSPDYGSWQPRVSAYEGGDKYVVVWEDKVSESDSDVFYRRYTASSGSAIDSTQQALSASTSGLQGQPAVDVMKCGAFVAGWVTNHYNSTFDIFGAFKN